MKASSHEFASKKERLHRVIETHIWLFGLDTRMLDVPKLSHKTPHPAPLFCRVSGGRHEEQLDVVAPSHIAQLTYSGHMG